MISSIYNYIVPINDRKYIFNLASQSIIHAEGELAQFFTGENPDFKFTSEEQQELLNNGILVESREMEVARLKNNINSLRYDRSRVGVFLSTTAGCNLNCTYCYQDKRKELNTNDYITPENWEVLLNHITSEIDKYNVKQFLVSLFGGEPMKDDVMCQRIVRDLKELEADRPNFKVQFVLITNGTLFTEENVEFYANNIGTIQITMDGTKEIHDKFRIYPDGTGSFDKIVSGLKLLGKHMKNMDKRMHEICLRINVNDDTADATKEFVDYLIDSGLQEMITAISLHEIFETQGEIIAHGGENRENIELAKKISELMLYAVSKGFRVPKAVAGPCIAKMATGYAIDENLNLYGCPGIVYSETHGQLLNDGTISITNPNWYNYYLNDPKCIDSCKYAPICYGGCNWAKDKQEKDCLKEIYDASLIPKLQAYILSKYAQ